MALLQDYKVLFEQNTEIKEIFYQGQRIWPSVMSTGPDYTEPFYVENITENTETFTIQGSNWASPTLEYSTDKETWTSWGTATSSTTLSLSIAAGDKVYLKGNNTTFDSCVVRGCSKVGGNTMSLFYGDDFSEETSFPEQSAASFYATFKNCTTLLDAGSLLLSATTLIDSCYQNMFIGCTALVNAPILQATTLATNCCNHMFAGCTSLTTAPELPATTLAESCYYHMFQGCTSLTTAPKLPATTLAESCYQSMFYGCTSLTTAPELPANTLKIRCYSNMFGGCTALVNVSTLPATTLASQCYISMFWNCTALTTAPVLPATTLAESCYQSMFYGCTSLVNVSTLPATTLANQCYSGMFQGCTALVNAPAILATTSATQCCDSMFRDCTNLSSITCMLSSYNSNNTYLWTRNVSASGTFTKAAGVSWESGESGIPSGWTVVEV